MTGPSPIGPATSTWLMPAAAATTAPANVDDQGEDAPRVGLLRRLQLTEPVRLTIYTGLVIATAGLQLAGVMTDQWTEFADINAGLIFGVGAAGEVIRSQVYSPAGVIRAARAAASAVTR